MKRRVLRRLASVAALLACGLLIAVLIFRGLGQASLWAAVVAALTGLLAIVTAVGPLDPAWSKAPLPPGLVVPEWVVDRPEELDAIVAALVGRRTRTVAITSALSGAGGFGKTILAQMVCANRRVRRRFRGRVYLITIGRDVRGTAAVAAKVNDLIKLMVGEEATYADPELAGQRLGSLLDAGPRTLLVLDDVWESQQMLPFLTGGKQCSRLITTRAPGLLTGRGVTVRVDQMSPAQARILLTAELPALDALVIEGLLAVTGRWPLLLRLVNQILADFTRLAPDVSAHASVLLDTLQADGPAAVDDLLGEFASGLDVGQPRERARAVRATIQASTSLLNSREAERFVELGIFAEDEVIPLSLIALLWQATEGLNQLQSAQVSKRLTQLALVSEADGGQGSGVIIHDVIRDYLRAELGTQLTRLNETLLAAIARDTPAVTSLDSAGPTRIGTRWWELGDQSQYMWHHLIEHLIDAGRHGEANDLASDLRWIGARLIRFGPAAPAADLSLLSESQTAARLRTVLVRSAHLLSPTEPTEAVLDILHSRVSNDSHWAPQVTDLRDECYWPRLANRWPPPDLPDSALMRVLTRQPRLVLTLAVAPNGSWSASGGSDGTIRIWDSATDEEIATLNGHVGWVRALNVVGDGPHLASGGLDGTVRIWDVATRQQLAVLKGHASGIQAIAVCPDGTWLASGGLDETVRIWDLSSSRERAVLQGHLGRVETVAVSLDGTWLASGGLDGKVRIWDAVSASERAVFDGHSGLVEALALGPDGSWLASGGIDGTVRLWDVSSGRPRQTLTGRLGRVQAVVVAPDSSWLAAGDAKGLITIWELADDSVGFVRPTNLKAHTGGVHAFAVATDGTWLASGGADGTVRIWDPIHGLQRPRHGQARSVEVVAVAPLGRWLATGGGDGTVQIQDLVTDRIPAVLQGHRGAVKAVAIGPDEGWLASGSTDRTVRIWEPAKHESLSLGGYWQPRAVLEGHKSGVEAVALAPDGAWLASASGDGTVRIWDVRTGLERRALRGHGGAVAALAVAPDGSWLASGGSDGTVRIWDVRTGLERRALRGHGGAVGALAVAPDGSWLASGGRDRTVRIWDMSAGQERTALKGHQNGVDAVAIAPDGSWLASGSSDGTLRVWDPFIGRAQALMRIDNKINSCAWNGNRIIAVGGPAGLYMFDFLFKSVRNAN
jgi:WD40 repeat protein